MIRERERERKKETEEVNMPSRWKRFLSGVRCTCVHSVITALNVNPAEHTDSGPTYVWQGRTRKETAQKWTILPLSTQRHASSNAKKVGLSEQFKMRYPGMCHRAEKNGLLGLLPYRRKRNWAWVQKTLCCLASFMCRSGSTSRFLIELNWIELTLIDLFS